MVYWACHVYLAPPDGTVVTANCAMICSHRFFVFFFLLSLPSALSLHHLPFLVFVFFSFVTGKLCSLLMSHSVESTRLNPLCDCLMTHCVKPSQMPSFSWLGQTSVKCVALNEKYYLYDWDWSISLSLVCPSLNELCVPGFLLLQVGHWVSMVNGLNTRILMSQHAYLWSSLFLVAMKLVHQPSRL